MQTGKNDDWQMNEEEQVAATSVKTMKAEKRAPKESVEFRERQ